MFSNIKKTPSKNPAITKNTRPVASLNSPGFLEILCTAVHVNISFQQHSGSFAFSFHRIPRQDGMSKHGQRKKILETKVKQRGLHELPETET